MGELGSRRHAGFYKRIVVTRVTPSYYAPGVQEYDFELEGYDLDLIPQDAVGIISTSNDDPMIYRYSQSLLYAHPVSGVTSTKVFVGDPLQSHNLNVPAYLGAIVSNDRNTVYWVNETQPLP